MKTILLFSRDPGGANTIIPLIRPLQEKGCKVNLYGKDVALEKYCQAGFEGTDINGSIPSISADTLRSFLEIEAPDMVVTGTSADDFTEKCLWLTAGELGIPSMAIVDQWVNYGLRFSGHTVSDISDYLNSNKHPYLPTRIIAMDEYARDEMISEGLPAERIKTCGQPYFESLLKSGRSDSSMTNGLSTIPGLSSDEFVVVFASEPITLTYGKNSHHWGYTERTIFTSLAKTLDEIACKSGKSMVLIIRPHPKEDPSGLVDIAISCCKHIKWIIDTKSHPWMLINRADLVCGMSSMFLVESLIIGKSTLSIQIGLCRDDPFVLARRGILKSIVGQNELLCCLTKIICHGDLQVPAFEVIANPVERIIAEMETLLCHS